MFWIILALAAGALLAVLLVSLRRYERESAAAALEEVTALREELDAITRRVQALEAIAAGDGFGEIEPPMLSEEQDLLSSERARPGPRHRA